jgi:tetratricopeptide (TPR) repeat protein
MPHTVTSRRVALVLALLGLSPAVAVAQQSSSNPYYEFLQARRLEGNDNFDAALAALQRAAAADPNSAEIKAEIADLYSRKSPPARTEVEKAAKEALAIDENNVVANRTLGFLIASTIDNRARTVTPQMAEDIKSAIGYLERAAAGTTGTDLQLQYTLGNLYLVNNEAPKAVQSLNRVVVQNPGNPSARQALARAYAVAGDLKGAIGTLEEVVDYLPNLAQDLALYQEQAGQLREAAASYSIALAVQPNNRQLKQRRILALYNAKDYQQAAALAGEARKQHPEDLNFPRLQARALFDGGDRTAGISVAEAAARAYPKDLATQFVLVDIYQDAGRPADAEKLLRQMLAANPSSAQVLNHLGYMLATRGEQLDEAVSLVRRALDSDPDRPEYLDSLGWAHFKRGELNDALKYLTQAADKLPNHSEIQDHLGDVQARRGALQEAITAWTKALAGNGEGIERAELEKKISNAKVKMQNAK